MNWTIRKATLDDAASIAACFRQSYTPNYPYALFDESVVRSNLLNTDVAMWVIEIGDLAVGTAAVIFDKERRKAELGRACIDPHYRGIKEKGRSPFQDLIEERVRYALDEGATILHSTAVTSHLKSQVGLQKGGFIPVCFEYGKYADLYGTQRETTIEMVYRDSPLLVKRRTRQKTSAKIPAIVEKVTSLLSLPFTAVQDYHATGCELSESIDQISNHAIISVIPGDKSIEDALLKITNARDKFDYVQIRVAAGHPSINVLYEALQSHNFSLAGYLPGWSNEHDFVVMQSLQNSLNKDKIQLTPQSRNFVKELGRIKL